MLRLFLSLLKDHSFGFWPSSSDIILIVANLKELCLFSLDHFKIFSLFWCEVSLEWPKWCFLYTYSIWSSQYFWLCLMTFSSDFYNSLFFFFFLSTMVCFHQHLLDTSDLIFYMLFLGCVFLQFFVCVSFFLFKLQCRYNFLWCVFQFIISSLAISRLTLNHICYVSNSVIIFFSIIYILLFFDFQCYVKILFSFFLNILIMVIL